jgi:hypothetical protein
MISFTDCPRIFRLKEYFKNNLMFILKFVIYYSFFNFDFYPVLMVEVGYMICSTSPHPLAPCGERTEII